MRRLSFLSLALAACQTAPVAPTPQRPRPVPELTQLQGATSEATALATSLCDTAGPRLPGSPGDAKAVAWAVETMTRLGLQNVHTEPVTVKGWVRGVERAELTSPLQQSLSVTALGSSVATPPGGLEAEVLEVTSLDALDALAPGAAAGKILFANVPMRRTVDGKGYGQAAPIRSRTGRQGALAGAVAALIRSVGPDQNRLPHTGSQGGPGPLPAAALSTPDADLLHRLLANGPVRLRLTLTPSARDPITTANVIGEVIGRERPDEVVLLGAHLDSWDLATGAQDDAAGVGIALDTARQLLALPRHPRRTVRVVLFANEENGLDGAQAYAAAHGAEHHVAGLESDGGGDRALSVTFGGSAAAAATVRTWDPWLAPLEVHVVDGPAHGGADLIPLRGQGLPVFSVQQDMSRYFDWHHSANDTVDKLDPAQHSQAARTFASVVWLAAEQGVDFGRLAPEDAAHR